MLNHDKPIRFRVMSFDVVGSLCEKLLSLVQVQACLGECS